MNFSKLFWTSMDLRKMLRLYSFRRYTTQDFAVTIDVIEARTGINFFPHLMDQNLETKIEAEVDVAKWKFSDARYQLRVKRWNFE